MLDIFLDGFVYSALLFFVVGREIDRPWIASSGKHTGCMSLLSHRLIVASPRIDPAKAQAAERALLQAEAKLMCLARYFSGKPCLSEIVMSAIVWIMLLGSCATQRFTKRLLHSAATIPAAKPGPLS